MSTTDPSLFCRVHSAARLELQNLGLQRGDAFCRLCARRGSCLFDSLRFQHGHQAGSVNKRGVKFETTSLNRADGMDG